ncbi:MAG: aminotransferase class V-fold PLP-dependent enzyme [Planctomycetales bacterium]|nr:aminotransferase class V-fold PLP-dependent enzyme [Planctomycetales bacterium]
MFSSAEPGWHKLRQDMAITEQWAYFDHAAVSPLSRTTAGAIGTWLRQATEEGDTVWPEWAARLEQLRASAARLVAASPDEIALVPNTTHGITMIAEGWPWQEGDNLVTLANEFPSNLYPWIHLRDRGVECRRLNVNGGRVDYEQLAAACDARTRIVSVSWIGYGTGFRVDVGRVAEIAHRCGACFFLDAIQGLGVFPLDVHAVGVDFLAADGHKWMMGPEGAGLLFVRRDLLNELRPLCIGWNSVQHRYDFSHIDLQLRAEAARYEGGTMNMAGFHGLAASLDQLQRIGAGPQDSAVGERILELRGYAVERLSRLSVEVLTSDAANERSGIVVFDVSGVPAETVRDRCRREGIVVSCRGGGVRISPHAYNTQDEIDQLIAVVAELAS